MIARVMMSLTWQPHIPSPSVGSGLVDRLELVSAQNLSMKHSFGTRKHIRNPSSTHPSQKVNLSKLEGSASLAVGIVEPV